MNRFLEPLAYRALPLLLALGVLAALHASGAGVAGAGSRSTTIAIGVLLMGSFIGGKMAKASGLPRITGYLLVGILVGPHLTSLVTKDMLQASKAIEGIAVALIALTAGGEIRMDWVRRQARRLTLITLSELTVVAAGIFSVVFLAREFLPFVPGGSLAVAAVVAMVFGAIAVANSPTVTIAVIAETRSEGPVTRTVLGVTILKDVCVIVLFAMAMAVAKDTLEGGAGGSVGLTILRELGGSMVAGVVFGIGIDLFLRHVGRDTPVFLLAICFAIWQASAALHLETLLVALTAGFWVENFARAGGHALIQGVERLSLPVYALFFAAAGAKVDLGALATLWPVAILLAAARAAFVWSGTWLGCALSGVEPEVRRYAWYGLISQAGVTLALSTIVARAFPGWGDDVQAIIIAMIGIHELVGPVVFQMALRRAGEAGKADGAAPEAGAAGGTAPAPAGAAR